MNNTDSRELQNYRHQNARHMIRKTVNHKVGAIRSYDRKKRIQEAAPTTSSVATAGAAGAAIGGGAIYGGHKLYNKGLYSHINKPVDDRIAQSPRTSAPGPQPGKTGAMYEQLENANRKVDLKKVEAQRVAHGGKTAVKGWKLAGRVGLGALAAGGLAAAGSYGWSKMRQQQEANRRT